MSYTDAEVMQATLLALTKQNRVEAQGTAARIAEFEGVFISSGLIVALEPIIGTVST